MVNVFIADDDEDLLEMVTLMLESSGMNVKSFHTGALLHKSINTVLPDILLMDIFLGDNDGRDLCRRLNLVTPGVPCIFYTGDTYEIHRQEALVAGARAYVPKPDVEALIDTVHRLMSERECAAA